MLQKFKQISSLWLLALGLLVATVLVWQGSRWTYGAGVESLAATGEERLSLYTGTLRGAINRYSYLPYVLAGNESVRAMLEGVGSAEEVNRYLEEMNGVAGSAALFVMDARGVTVASSNWRDALSFVGHDYSFRPYFTDARRGREGRFFAIGITTGIPGFFMSRAVLREGRFVGVAVVKIDLDTLQEEWREGGETVLVSDANGVLFLSSRNDWKYGVLKALTPEQRRAIRAEHQYGDRPLEPIPMRTTEALEDGLRTVRTDRQNYLMVSRPLPLLGWKLHYLAPLEPVREKTQAFAIIGVVLSLLLLALAMYGRERHQKQLSRRKAREADAVRQVNERLKAEIDEHRRTELALRNAQHELVQSSKLAALGQMAAGIVHELNQPISAMRTYAASGRLLFQRNQPEKVLETFASIGRLTDHMGYITSQLKIFAYKSSPEAEPVLLQDCLNGALKMTESLLQEASVEVEKEVAPEPMYVKADRIRVEQVLVNLIRNAADAMQEADRPVLTLALSREGGMASIVVDDTGCGIAEESLDKLFDPFYTTKEVGKGLGLGLSITYRILTDLGGTLRAENRPEGGARLTVRLPITSQAQGEIAS